MEYGKDCILIILAAGEASRMGEAKQLLPVFGVPLIDFQVPRWRKVFGVPPVIVTGARDREVREASSLEGVRWVWNRNWNLGIGSSIQTAIRASLQHHPDAGACMIILLDQAFIGPVHLLKLLDIWVEHPNMIVASRYGGTSGPPVIFPKAYWNELLEVPPEKGAAVLFRKFTDRVIQADIPAAGFDLDTPSDKAIFDRALRGQEKGVNR